MEVKGGVPQGSVLGPTLWNILYDDVLRLELPEGVTQIGFADDLAIVIKAGDEEDLTYRANEALRRIEVWMVNNQLELAPEKTEMLVMKGPRKRDELRFRVGGCDIRPSRTAKYLGVVLDEFGTFKAHLEYASKKAEERTSLLARIMPNVGGPTSKRREALSWVVHSIILYGAPIWIGAMETGRLRKKLASTQRKALLRVIGGYRTISARATQVIAGVPPIWLMAAERAQMFYSRETGENTRSKKEEREATLELWQEEWDSTDEGGTWTKRLIPDIKAWVQCTHREVDYWLTQFLSGHGAFGSYLKRFKIRENDKCLYCEKADSPEHTVFYCNKWECKREELKREISTNITPDNIIGLLINSKEQWTLIKNFIKDVLKQKVLDGM